MVRRTSRSAAASAIVYGAAILVTLAVGAVVAIWMVRPSRLAHPADRRAKDAAQVAQEFLRHVVASDLGAACLIVVDPGSFLNPCIDDLSRRDLGPVVALGPEVEVTRAIIGPGGNATVSGGDLDPRSSADVVVTLRAVGTDWRVTRLLNTDVGGNG